MWRKVFCPFANECRSHRPGDVDRYRKGSRPTSSGRLWNRTTARSRSQMTNEPAQWKQMLVSTDRPFLSRLEGSRLECTDFSSEKWRRRQQFSRSASDPTRVMKYSDAAVLERRGWFWGMESKRGATTMLVPDQQS